MFIIRFIAWVFNTVIEQRNRALRAAMERDPKYQEIQAEVKRTKANIDKWVERELERDPRMAGRLAAIRGPDRDK